MTACQLRHWMDTIQHKAQCRAAVARPKSPISSCSNASTVDRCFMA